ncbi:MAG: GGDEF domain-containing protein [Phycisphaeraceae bacterium]|nr:GGDEF domain-containing protein [Phycisphaeraceae bacterium]
MAQDVQQQRQARRERTISQIGRLRLNPGPVLKVMQADGNDPDHLIKALAQCPVLSARVIGVANSAGSSAIHRMDSIDRCVRHLGAKQTRTIALTMAMQQMVDQLDVDQDLVRSLWASAAFKATAAQLIAETVSPEEADRAYSLGLLQDIGLPVLLAVDPDFFQNKLAGSKGKSSWIELERAHFGIDHAELGAVMLQSWNAPTDIVLQVGRHHQPLNDDDMAWLAEMPTRIAGLLPHLDEQTTKDQSQTLAAAHARFLSESFDTLDALLAKVKQRFKLLGKAAGGTSQVPGDFVGKIIECVTGDTFSLAAKVSRLERQLAQQVDALAYAQQDARSDTLTGLLNRRGFESFAQQMLAQAAKASLSVACLMIDLDDFKPINDTYGHAAGDRVLTAAAELLQVNTAKGDLVARVGGDEFAVLILGDQQGDAYALAQRLHAVCNGKTIDLGTESKATLAMSIGGVFLERVTNTTTADQLTDAADQVMYRIKRAGKAGLKFEAMKRKAA